MVVTSKIYLSDLVACDRTEPPQCCHPMTPERWEDAGRRLMAARAAAEASRPKACANCGSDDIFPTFDPTANYFECNACSNVFEVER